MMIEDGPIYTEIGLYRPKAAKEYICGFCRKPIKKGERHIKYVWKDEDNKFHSDRHHIVCPWEQEHP